MSPAQDAVRPAQPWSENIADAAAPGRLDTWRGYAICVAILLSAVAYSFRLTSFLIAKEAALAACLCAVAALVAVQGRFTWRGVTAFLPLWLLLGYELIGHGLLWPAAVRADLAVEVARLAMLLLMAAFAYDLLGDPPWRQRVANAFLVSAAICSLLALGQYGNFLPFLFPKFAWYDQRAYSVFGNQDLLGGYLAMALPLFTWRILKSPQPPLASLAGLAAVAAALLISGSRSAWLAAACGVALTFPYRHLRFRRLGVWMGTLAVVGIIAAATAPEATVARIARALSAEDQGVRARLWFWDGTVRMICDKPLLGHGLGNYAYWSPRYLGEALHAQEGGSHYHNELHAVHAHAAPLELLAETGAVGAALLLWMLLRLARCRGPEWGPLAALFVFSLFNAPFHSAPHALNGALFAGALLARRKSGQEQEAAQGARRPRAAAYGLPACTLLVAFFSAWAVLLPSFHLRAAESVHLAGGDPLPLYERALAHRWPHAYVHHECGMALLVAGRNEEAEHQFQEALRGLDTGEVYLGLGLATAAQGDETAARKWFEECLLRWPYNEEAWRGLIEVAPIHERPQMQQRAARWLAP